MALLKYEVKCTNESCEKSAIILVDPDEQEVPSLCPFCGADVIEVNE